MHYPIKTTFYAMTEIQNDYGETVKSKSTPFTIGARLKTMKFTDALQRDLKLDDDRQFVYVRKTPKTMAIALGDEVTMVGVSSRTYSVSAIDYQFTNRSEIMFLIESVEEK